MKPRHPSRRNAFLLSLPAVLWFSGIQEGHAQLTTNRYWDPASSGSFGSIATTNPPVPWVSPVNVMWTNSDTGGSTRLQNYSTTLTDICNWGGPTAALGGGTLSVGTVNAGWLRFNTISGTGVTLSGGTITLNAEAKIIVNNTTFNHTISSTLAGAATTMRKEGPGTIILSGSNTFAGPTAVTAGTLTLANSNALLNSPLDTTATVTGSATAGLKATVPTLTFGGLSGTQDLASVFTTTSGGFGSVTSLTLNPGSAITTTYSGVIADGAVGMGIAKSGLGTQVLAGANTFTGSTTVNAGKLTLDYSTQDNSKMSDTGALVLGSGTLELSGGTHTEVVASTTLNGTATVTRSSGTAVLALGAVSGPGSVDFSADSIATTTNTNDATGILPFATIAGNLAANDGSGNIISYSGYVNIDARGPSTVPDSASANVRILGDGTSGNIDLAATTTTINALLNSNANFAATIDTASKTLASNSITLGVGAESLNVGVAAGDGSLNSPISGGALALNNYNPAKPLTINAAIVDNSTASTLSTGGPGSVVLAGPNSHTGSTTANDGTLVLSGSLTDSPISVTGDAVFDQTSTGVIGGVITITHDSTGASILGGANTYGGVTSINTGSISIRNDTALGDTSDGTTVASGASLLLENNITTGGEALSINGNGVAGTGALRNVSGNNTYGGPITLAGSALIASDADSLTLSDTGNLNGSGFTLSVGGAGNTTINNIINTGSGGLAKAGTGTLILTGANTFTGNVSVNGGVLNLRNNAATGTIAGGVGVVAGAALELQGGITVGNEPLNLVGTGVSNSGALRNISGDNTWGGLISLSVASRIRSDSGTLILDVATGNAIAGTGVAGAASSNVNMTFGGDGNFTVADPITSGNLGTGVLTKEGTGTLTLQAANTYTGPTVVAAGLISLTNALALQNSPLDTTTTVTGDASNGLKTNTTALTIGGLIGNKNLADVFTTTSGGYGNVTALTLNNGLARTYDGIIADGAAGMTLTKSGAGVQTLTGANTYTGGTRIEAGSLSVSTINSVVGGSASSNLGAPTNVSSGTIGFGGIATTGTLAYTGIGESIDRVINLAGGSGGATLEHSGTGTLAFTSDLTATGVGSKTLTLQGPVGGAGEITGAIVDNGTTGTTQLAASYAAAATTATLASVDGVTVGATISGTGIAGSTISAINTTTKVVTFSPSASGAGTAGQTMTVTGVKNITSLTKSGTGTWTLSDANTYTGATTVSAGTLALVGGSQASPITVNNGASLGFTLGSGTTSTSSVTFIAGSTVVINGTPTLPSYTLMTASSFLGVAPVLSAPIAGYELKVEGGNTLKLVQPGYVAWAALNGAGPNLSDDHDGDGVDNGTEYFLVGPNGNSTGFTALPGVVNTAGILSVTWPKGAGYIGVYGTDFVVETSATLSGPWTTEASPGNVADSPANVIYTFPGGPAYTGKNFARLKVTGP